MAGKNSLLVSLLTVLLFSSSLCQGVEEQRKYLITNEAVLSQLFDDQRSYGGVRMLHHSDDNYYDIYLDSPDFLLKRKGYSLRFRRRHASDTIITYSLQLKSEMTDLNGIRMEVEEQELSFYRIFKDSNWVSITTILDPLFNYSINGQKTAEIETSLTLLKDWINFKSGAPILPFQQLKAIDPLIFSDQQISSFLPLMSGRSVRSRFHGVYEPEDDQLKISMNRRQESLKPEMIRKNPSFNWVLEASYDKSTFRSITDPGKIMNLTEFEVENKYFIPETGRLIIDQFEKDVLEKLQFKPSIESKYIRALEILFSK